MNRRKSILRIALLLLLTASIFCLPLIYATSVQAEDKSVKIGVLAKRGMDYCRQKWTPTADYLGDHIAGHSFAIVPLSFEQIVPAVEKQEVDFILVNPGFYVVLEVRRSIERIVTLVNKDADGRPTIDFAGAIVTLAARDDIKTLPDLVGKRFVSTNLKSFGGWQMVKLELLQNGIRPDHDFAALTFAGTHDQVIYEIRDGQADAGTVRTNVLERMAKEGKIDLADFKVLPAEDLDHHTKFSFVPLHSTPHCPEWPLAKLHHTDNQLAERVAVTLIQMPVDTRAAQQGLYYGWTIPKNYQIVHDCLKTLREPPYEDHGKPTLSEAYRQFWPVIMGILSVILVVISLLSLRLLIGNRRLQRAIAAQRQSQNKFRIMMETMRDPVYIGADDYRVEYMNPAMIKRCGRDATGEFCYQALHDFDQPCPWCKNRDKHRGKYFESEVVSPKDNRSYQVSHSPIVKGDGSVSKLTIFRDTTEFKKMEAQFYQAQKMEAIGTLAGGVAHDFNNILTVIQGHAQLGMMQTTKENPLWNYLAEIEQAGDRAANLTRQLLAFSRKQAISPEMILINYLVNDLGKMLKRLIGEDFNLKFKLGEKLSPILADPGQLEQVIINLVVNAADAIKEQPLVSGRNITIATSEVLLDSDFVLSQAGSRAGWHLLLEITDNGCGITKEVMEHIFEPFYTTKEVGKGTGLGLSTVYGIVKQNHAAIYIESEPGLGTTFKIYWPSAKSETVDIVKAEALEPAPGGNEVILLAEDDEGTRDIARRMLQRAGYTVIEAENGREALTKAKAFASPIDLLFTDIVMPLMGGKELSEKLTAIRPQIEVLFTSGHLGDRVNRNDQIFKDERFINKPYSVAALLRKIRRLLDN